MSDAITLDEISELTIGEYGPVVHDQHLWQPQCGKGFPYFLDCGL